MLTLIQFVSVCLCLFLSLSFAHSHTHTSPCLLSILFIPALNQGWVTSFQVWIFDIISKICPMFVLSSLTQSTLPLQFSLAKQLYLGILDHIHIMYMYLLALKKKALGSPPTHLVFRSEFICVNNKGHIQKEENWGFLETGLHFFGLFYISSLCSLALREKKKSISIWN